MSWTILAGLLTRALGLAGTIVITNALEREVLGEVSDASIVLLLADQLSTIGVGQFVVAKPDADRDVVRHAAAMHLLLGAIAIAVCFAASGSLSQWTRAPSLGVYLPWLAVSVSIDRVTFIPERLLARDMRFRRIAIARASGDVGYTIVAVALATQGFGGMSVVFGNVVRSLARATIVLASVPRADWLARTRFDGRIVRRILRFGVPVSIGASASSAARRLDNLLVSGLWGAGTLGVYNLAYNLADVPAVQVGEQIGDVLLPAFARMDAEPRRRALVRSMGLLALVVFPLATGLGAIAPTLVAALLRAEWSDVAPMLTLLSALSVSRPVGWTFNSYLQARDAPRTVMALEGLKLFALVACMLSIGRLGPHWPCIAVGLAFTLHALAGAWVVHRRDGVPIGAMLARLALPLLACAPMVGAVFATRAALGQSVVDAPGACLVAEIASGALAYVVAATLLAPSMARDLVALARRAFRRTDAASSRTPA